MMKKLITIAGMLLALTAHSQTKVVKDANGNYVSASRNALSKPTGHTFTDAQGKTYPVFISARGKLYYMRTSRNGNVYKAYIKQ